jgi:hypothetical protein
MPESAARFIVNRSIWGGRGILIRKQAERAVYVSQRARHIARLAQIPFDFAQGRLSLRKERLLGMTNKLWDGGLPAARGVI